MLLDNQNYYHYHLKFHHHDKCSHHHCHHHAHKKDKGDKGDNGYIGSKGEKGDKGDSSYIGNNTILTYNLIHSNLRTTTVAPVYSTVSYFIWYKTRYPNYTK